MFGKVDSFDSKKRYGFILGDDGRRYFVHSGSINIPSGNLDRGYMVSFTPTLSSRGYAAADVNLL